MSGPHYVIGVDVGGTNTDTAILCGSQVVGQAKRPTTRDKTEGVVNSIQAALDSLTDEHKHQILSSTNVRVSIGTTHFTNAVVERDERNLSRVAVIRLCGKSTRSLPPFVDIPEDLCRILYGGVFLVAGGLEYNRQEISSVDEGEIRECVRRCLSQDPPVRNFVICGVFSPCDDPHDNQETRAAAIVRDECQQRSVECSCTLSHELAMLGLLERENASILNESLKALAGVTIQAFVEALSKLNLSTSSGPSFFLTQNDGTLISADEAKRYPVLTFSSGPTNSMRGAAFLSGRLNAIVVDIGGTTTDVGVLVNGFPRQASTQCEVGGVRTNFPMPDVHSIGLGGGSHVNFDPDSGQVEVGPSSVGYEITSKALCFGGQRCTATDVAIAAGIAPSDFCTAPQALSSLSPGLVRASVDEMKRKLERIIDSMKTENEPWPVILVGGGSILMDRNVQLKGVSTVECPEKYWGVANAVGAALGTVGGSSDKIENLAQIREQLVTANPDLKSEGAESLDKRARNTALAKGRELAKEEVKRKGGLVDTVYIHSEELTDITYVMDRVRVRVKAIGSLTQDDARTAARPYVAALTTPTEMKTDTMEVGGTEYTPTTPSPVADCPSWPNRSEEERKNDIDAGLPLPNVDKNTGVWILSEHDVICLATGAGILGCGGGGSPYHGQLQALQLIKEGKNIKIVNPCRVREEERGLVCGVAFMGAPAILVEKLPNGQEASIALDRLERVLVSGVCDGVGGGRVSGGGVTVTEKQYPRFDGTNFPAWVATDTSLMNVDLSKAPKKERITALICLEAGGCNSIEPLLVGAMANLPVLDVDGMGRAFPELQMFVPFINGSRHSPSSLADNQGEVITCSHMGTSKDLENFFRAETVRMGLSAAIATGVMTYSEMLVKSVMFTMSQAWQLGRAVFRARKLHTNAVRAVVEQQHGMVLLTGKIITVHRETKAGFTTIEALVEGLNEYAGYQLRVLAKNENYVAQQMINGRHGEVLAVTPDLICIIDSDNGEAITTEMMRYGLRVGVVVLPANQMLKTANAIPVVGPRAFGFDIPYREPMPLPKTD